MIFTNEGACFLTCECGCGNTVTFRRVPGDRENIYVSFLAEMFYVTQKPRSRIIDRLRGIHAFNRTSFPILFDIEATEDDMLKLKQFLDGLDMTDGGEAYMPARLCFTKEDDALLGDKYIITLEGANVFKVFRQKYHFRQYELILNKDEVKSLSKTILSIIRY